MKSPYQIIQTVVVTEKGTEMIEDLNKYSFKVSDDANKIEIRNAIEEIFDVKVSSVNVLNRKGKRKRLRHAKYGKRPDWKKAIVTLSEGEIDIL